MILWNRCPAQRYFNILICVKGSSLPDLALVGPGVSTCQEGTVEPMDNIDIVDARNSEIKLALWLSLWKQECGWEGPSFAWGCSSFPLVNGKNSASLEGEWEAESQAGAPGRNRASLLTTQGPGEASLQMIQLVLVPAPFPNCIKYTN